jgi:O-antigen ligase
MATISVIGGFLIFIIYYSIIFLKELKFLFLMPMTIILVFFFINNNNRIYDQLIIKTDRYVGGFSKPLNIIDSPHGAHWLTAYKIFKNNLYIGSGLKNFKIKCSKNIYSSPIKFNEERCSTHPHNMLLEFLSETGILGTIMFLTFLFTITLKKIIFFKNPYYCSIFLSIILYLFPLATSGSFFSTWNGGFFWLFLGLLLALQRNLKKTS